jgi:small subunit ribosomal protein S4e
LPLAVIIRDVLKLVRNRKEAKKIIKQGAVRVDGKVRREEKFPVGLMDVIEIPGLGAGYRVVPSRKGLTLHAIKGEELKFKLCRIEGKTTVRDGHVQLNLHDGGNVLVRVMDPFNPKEDVYKTSDVLKLSLPDRKILDHIKMREGVQAVVIDGKHIGRRGKVRKIEHKIGLHPTTLVALEGKEGVFQTAMDYVFATGTEKPLISLAGP